MKAQLMMSAERIAAMTDNTEENKEERKSYPVEGHDYVVDILRRRVETLMAQELTKENIAKVLAESLIRGDDFGVFLGKLMGPKLEFKLTASECKDDVFICFGGHKYKEALNALQCWINEFKGDYFISEITNAFCRGPDLLYSNIGSCSEGQCEECGCSCPTWE